MDLSSILQNLTEDDIKKLQETAASFFGSADGAVSSGGKRPGRIWPA